MFTGITDEDLDLDRDPDPGRPNLRRNDADREAGTVRGTGTRDDVGNIEAVLEIETEREATEGTVPTGIEIARGNGKKEKRVLKKKSFSMLN